MLEKVNRSRKSRARRVLGVLGAVVATTVTFTTAAAASVVFHLDLPATRRLVATQVSSIVGGMLAGDVRIEHIAHLGLDGVDGVRVRVRDPDGLQVLFVDGVKVRVRGLEAARSALFGKGPIRVMVDEARVAHADVSVDADKNGQLRLTNAFAPEKPSPPEDPNKPKGRGVLVEAPEVALHHAWAHGVPPGGVRVDAEIHDLRANAHVDPAVTRAAITQVDLVSRGLPRGADPRGRLTGDVVLPAPSGAPFAAGATYAGTVGGVPVSLDGRMDGKRVDAVLDVRSAAGADVTSLVGEGVRFTEDVRAHAEVHGELPHLDAGAQIALGGRGRVDTRASLTLGEKETRIDARVAARHVDLAKVLPKGPTSDLGLDARADVALAEGNTRVALALDTLPGTLEKDDVPRVSVRGELDGERAHGRVRVLGDVAPIEADVAMFPEGGDRIVEADVRGSVPELAKLPGPLAVARGRAALRANGRVALDAGAVSARVTANAQGVQASGQRVDDVRLLASVSGSLTAPVVAVGVRAEGIRSGELAVPSADVRATVMAGEGGVSVHDAHVDVNREGRHVGVSASRIEVQGPELRVDGAVVDGLGDQPLRAEVKKTGARMAIKVDAPSLDLARIAGVLGRGADVQSGHLALAADMVIGPGELEGEVRARVDGASAFGLRGAGLELDASVHDRHATIGVDAALAQAGRFRVRADHVHADGDPSRGDAWARASGKVDIDGDVDLAQLQSFVPGGAATLSELAGRVMVRGAITRATPGGAPDVRLHAKTRGFVIAGPVRQEPPIDGVEVKSAPPYRSEGLDVEIDALVDAASRDAEIAVRAIDPTSVVAAVDVKASVPFDVIARNPAAARSELEKAPFRAKVVVPERALVRMPRVLALQNVGGTVGLDLDIGGTALDPRVELVAHGRGVRSPAFGVDRPADADVRLTYDGKRADLGVEARAGGGAIRVASHVDVDARSVLHPDAAARTPWTGGTRVELASFPLDAIGAVADRRVKGKASGVVTLEGLNRDARLGGHIDLAELRVGRTEYPRGRIELAAGEGGAKADVKLEQKDGFAEIHATTGLQWGSALAPSIDPSRPVEASLTARKFRLAVLDPFVTGPVAGVDGSLDGDVRVRLLDSNATLEGGLALTDGRAQVTALGQELRDIRAKVAFERDGVIRVDGVRARGLAGQVHADALVKLQGMSLASANANIRIPSDEKFDVSLQGQPLGEVWGDVKISAAPDAESNEIDIKVDVPKLSFVLPATTKSGVQELAEKPKIRVGTYKDKDTFVRLPLDREDLLVAKGKVGKDGQGKETKGEGGTGLDVQVHLGEVIVERGNMARVVVEGNPRVRIADGETQVTGQVQVREGEVDVRGKEFEVQRAIVTFTGDPANPTVVATASWEAGDGTQVYADFVGPVKTGKVNLRSEPPRPKNEILALILFGTADGANPTPRPAGTQTDTTAKTAAGLGGGLAAQGLTEALDDLAGIEAQARIDTTSSNNPRPELEIQLTSRISLEVSHVLGTPPIAEPDKNYATVEWRFRRNWSLETTFGDRGRALFDAVWQKRY